MSGPESQETQRPNSPAARGSGGSVMVVNPLEQPDWDQWLANDPRSTFFQSTAWARVLVETYGYTPVYLVTEPGGGRRAVLPLMEVNSWLTGRRGIGLPFTDECDPLCDDGNTFHRLFERALELGRVRGWKSVECRGGEPFLAGKPASLEHYTHRINLLPDEPARFARLDGSVRRAIRKAEKAGVTVEISRSLEAVKAFYRLLGITRKRHGLPPQPFSLFLNIFHHVLRPNMGIVVVARKGHTPVGAAVYFCRGDRAIYKYGASDERYQQWRGNNLVMWEAIKWCARNGIRSLSLGRTSTANAGLRRFKLGWGAEEGRTLYFKFDLRRQQYVVEQDETEGWHNRIFRASPRLVSRLAGRLLYRHWA